MKRLCRPRLRGASSLVLPLANLGQAIPSIGVLALLAIWVGFGFSMGVIALVLVSFLSVLRNTMVGVTGVDRSLIEAARGMGLSKSVVMFRVELPLAVPVILAGIRVALILNVGSATLATYTINPRPELVTALSTGLDTELIVQFSKPLEENSAEQTGNYGISGGVTVNGPGPHCPNELARQRQTMCPHSSFGLLTNQAIRT